MALPCLPKEGAEALPPAAVLYLPLVRSERPTPTPTWAPEDTPALVAPSDGSNLSTLAPELVWRSAGPHWYGIEVAVEPTFSDTAASLSPCAYYGGPEHTVPLLSNLEPATLHYWRVGYEDNGGRFVWSEVRSFTTAEPGGATPPASLPSVPPNGSTVVSLRPRLAWQHVPGATMYHVTLGVAGNCFGYSLLTPVAEVTLPFSLLPGRVYAWHVRARNGYAWGPESQTWTFSTPSN